VAGHAGGFPANPPSNNFSGGEGPPLPPWGEVVGTPPVCHEPESSCTGVALGKNEWVVRKGGGRGVGVPPPPFRFLVGGSGRSIAFPVALGSAAVWEGGALGRRGCWGAGEERGARPDDGNVGERKPHMEHVKIR